jgi:NDP-sugar pyrophosphorylase family protein
MSLPAAAILAGGLATRLGPETQGSPKSLVDVAGMPFIHRQLMLLSTQGVEQAVVCAGHLGRMIRESVGDGSAFGLKVEYSFDGDRLLGTGGALKKALPLLGPEFFTLYGDSGLEEPLAPVAAAFRASGRQALMTVFRNENRLIPSNVEFSQGRILAYGKASPTPAMRHADYGLGLFKAGAFRSEEAEAFDLASFYGKLLAAGQLAGWETASRFWEIGSPEGLAETREHLRQR